MDNTENKQPIQPEVVEQPVKENPIQVNLVKEYARLSQQIDNINKRLAEADKPQQPTDKIEKDILI